MKLKRLQAVAHLISYLAHPLLMPLWVIVLAVYANPYLFDMVAPFYMIRLLVIVFINFVAFPALAVLLMLQLKLVNSVHLENYRERILPFIATGSFYIWGYVVISKSEYPIIISKPLLGVVISLFTAFFINIFTKISIHAIGIAGLVTAAIILNNYSSYSLLPLISVGILLTGIIGSARFVVHAHTLSQIMFGTFVGVLAMVIGFWV